MSKESPLISILMATYNRAHLIVEMLDSIVAQEYENWECIIVDDGGTDHTKEVISPLLKREKRFIYKTRPETYKKGLPGCRNYALDIARGHYIIFFDDDDYVHPEILTSTIEVLQNNEDSYFCNFKKQSFQDRSEIEKFEKETIVTLTETTPSILEDFITGVTAMASCTVLWDSVCFDSIRFNESLQYAEEWECYHRIFTTHTKGLILNKTLYYNRKHENSNTGEFWTSNPKRIESKIEASKLIITHLNLNKLLTPKLQNFFVWTSVRMNTREIIDHLINQSELSSLDKLKALFRYKASPLIKVYLRLKK